VNPTGRRPHFSGPFGGYLREEDLSELFLSVPPIRRMRLFRSRVPSDLFFSVCHTLDFLSFYFVFLSLFFFFLCFVVFVCTKVAHWF